MDTNEALPVYSIETDWWSAGALITPSGKFIRYARPKNI